MLSTGKGVARVVRGGGGVVPVTLLPFVSLDLSKQPTMFSRWKLVSTLRLIQCETPLKHPDYALNGVRYIAHRMLISLAIKS